MKIYIVTSGSYEDYGIRKVFLDQEKAAKYAEISNMSKYDESYYVESYNTSDDIEINKITYVEANYAKWLDGDEDEIYVDINFECSANFDPEYLNRTSVNIGNSYREVRIERVIDNEYDEDSIKTIYENIIRLVMSKVEELIDCGHTEEIIDEWLKQNIDTYFN